MVSPSQQARVSKERLAASSAPALADGVGHPNRRPRETIGFSLLLVLHVLPIWCFSILATQDGPAHIYNGFALLHLSKAPFRLFYEVNQSFHSANWPAHLALGVLTTIFSPGFAEKTLQTAYVVAFALGFRHALARIAPRAPRVISWAAFPFVYSYPFHMGFYSYCLGIALFFIGLGSWATFRARPGTASGARWTVLLIVVFLFHPLPLVLLLVVPPVELGYRAALDLWRARSRARRRGAVFRGVLARAVRFSLWSAPALALHAVSAVGRGTRVEWQSPLRSAISLLMLSSLSSHDIRELFGSASIALLVWATAAWLLVTRRPRRLRMSDSWLAVALALLLAALFVPDKVSGGSLIKLRVEVLPYLVTLLWVGCEAMRRRIGTWQPKALAIASVFMIGLRLPVYARLSRDVAAHDAVLSSVLPQGSLVLPVRIGFPSDSLRIDVLLHALDRVSVERGIIDLGNYQA
ncbi:MAG TPA: hypothetical protein VMK12_12365, partial [Anaeromyxobacteraceae bacterium]|nr:hypothetical protein [Anaeromyxobacteraceae bacterium]